MIIEESEKRGSMKTFHWRVEDALASAACVGQDCPKHQMFVTDEHMCKCPKV